MFWCFLHFPALFLLPPASRDPPSSADGLQYRTDGLGRTGLTMFASKTRKRCQSLSRSKFKTENPLASQFLIRLLGRSQIPCILGGPRGARCKSSGFSAAFLFSFLSNSPPFVKLPKQCLNLSNIRCAVLTGRLLLQVLADEVQATRAKLQVAARAHPLLSCCACDVVFLTCCAGVLPVHHRRRGAEIRSVRGGRGLSSLNETVMGM